MKETKATIHDRLTAATFMLIEAAHMLNEIGVSLNDVCDKIDELKQRQEEHNHGWKCDSCPVRDFSKPLD